MSRSQGSTPTTEQIELVRWAGSLGAISAPSLAFRSGVSVASARARLSAAERRLWLERSRPLAGWPTLYTATRAGLRVAGPPNVTPARVSPASAMHFLTCAAVAAALERCHPDHAVLGERELRGGEHEPGGLRASADLGVGARGVPIRHSCDLVLVPGSPADGLPVAVEVELTVKAPARLATICLAWARCRHLAGAVYIAPADVARAVRRAARRANALQRIAVVELDALPWPRAD
jgi:hypothetical protein